MASPKITGKWDEKANVVSASLPRIRSPTWSWRCFSSISQPPLAGCSDRLTKGRPMGLNWGCFSRSYDWSSMDEARSPNGPLKIFQPSLSLLTLLSFPGLAAPFCRWFSHHLSTERHWERGRHHPTVHRQLWEGSCQDLPGPPGNAGALSPGRFFLLEEGIVVPFHLHPHSSSLKWSNGGALFPSCLLQKTKIAINYLSILYLSSSVWKHYPNWYTHFILKSLILIY